MPFPSNPPFSILASADVTVGRAFAVTYTNNTGRTMFVNVTIQQTWIASSARNSLELIVGGVQTGQAGWLVTPAFGAALEDDCFTLLSFWVMPGQTYRIQQTVTGGSTNTIAFWIESN